MTEKPDKDSKTEEATEKKVRDSIERGNVPFSREATTFVSLGAMFISAALLFSSSVIRLEHSLLRFIDNPGDWKLENGADAVALLQAIIWDIAPLVLPVVLLLMVAGIGSALLQNPPQMVAERIQPKWSRVSPMAGWQRLFSLRGLVEFGKALFKLSAVTIVGFMAFKASQFDVLSAMFMEPIAIPELMRKILLRIIGWVALLTLAMVVADLLWSRVHWRQELRMTKQEVKDEHRQTEGDPHVKARLKGLLRSRARKRMIAAVPNATLVIANPTHYAVALRYIREEGGAPMVLAKGIDDIALKIREIAEEHDIPVIVDKPLARSLYEAVDVDKFIPPQFYKAVAEIIYHLHLRRQRT